MRKTDYRLLCLIVDTSIHRKIHILFHFIIDAYHKMVFIAVHSGIFLKIIFLIFYLIMIFDFLEYIH